MSLDRPLNCNYTHSCYPIEVSCIPYYNDLPFMMNGLLRVCQSQLGELPCVLNLFSSLNLTRLKNLTPLINATDLTEGIKQGLNFPSNLTIVDRKHVCDWFADTCLSTVQLKISCEENAYEIVAEFKNFLMTFPFYERPASIQITPVHIALMVMAACFTCVAFKKIFDCLKRDERKNTVDARVPFLQN